jgi:hypothetical protein
MDVSITKMCLDILILEPSNINRREYINTYNIIKRRFAVCICIPHGKATPLPRVLHDKENGAVTTPSNLASLAMCLTALPCVYFISLPCVFMKICRVQFFCRVFSKRGRDLFFVVYCLEGMQSIHGKLYLCHVPGSLTRRRCDETRQSHVRRVLYTMKYLRYVFNRLPCIFDIRQKYCFM